MEWANNEFSGSATGAPSRLIVMLDKPGDPQVEAYLDEMGYEAAGDRAANGKAAYFLSLVTSIVVGVGLVISLLAFFILLLSIYLLLQKNSDKIRQLMQLGYSPAQVSRYYHRIIIMVNVAVILLAIGVMTGVSAYWSQPLSTLGVEPTSPWFTMAVGLGIMAVITLGNLIAVSRAVRKRFYS